MYKVSIVVPVYNVELYLRECIESLAAQTYNDLEIILVDDGSTDSSGSICEEYAKVDDRIHVIHQNNVGAANAKNIGIDTATGEYLTFVDSDDFVEPEWIATMMDAAISSDADLVECSFDLYYKNHTKTVKEVEGFEGIFTSESYLAQYLERWTCSLFWNKLFKRKLTENIRFRKERRCIDDEFYTYKVISNAERICCISKVLYHYRQRTSSAVKNEKNQFQITEDALEVLIERYEWIKRHFKNLRKIYLEHDMEFLLYFSEQGTYNDRLVEIYRKKVWYYIMECFRGVPSKKIAVYFLLLLKCKPQLYKKAQIEDLNRISDDWYFL